MATGWASGRVREQSFQLCCSKADVYSHEYLALMTTMENCNMDLPPHSPLLFKRALWALVKNECIFLTLLLIYNEITIQQRDCPVSYHHVTAVPGSVLLMYPLYDEIIHFKFGCVVVLLSCDLLSHLRNTAAFRIIQLELPLPTSIEVDLR